MHGTSLHFSDGSGIGGVITPMGSCYFEVTQECKCYEKWYGTVLVSREFSPSTIPYTGTKHGETHTGDLSISAPAIGELESEDDSDGYHYKTYKATATYCGYLACDGDISEMKLD